MSLFKKSGKYEKNQNGSSELMHYGVKGMKWGVRRTPEQLGNVSKTDIKVGGRPLTALRIKNYNRFTESQQNSINSNRIEFIFGSPTNNNTGRYSFTDRDGNTRTATITRNEKGQYDIRVHNQSGQAGFSRVMFDDNYEAILVSLGYSEEEAKEMIAQADLNWMEENGIQDEKTEMEERLKELERRRKRPREMPNRDQFRKRKVSSLKKDKDWKQKFADGAQIVENTLRKFGNQAVEIAKETGSKAFSGINKVIKSGKVAVNKIFNKNEEPKVNKISKEQYVRSKWKTLDSAKLPYTPSSYYYSGLSKHPKPNK